MKTRKLVLMALFIVIEIVFTRFMKIEIPTLRISFTFVVMAVAGTLFGVIPSAIIAGIADVLGFFLWPSGTYFIGFTISSVIVGGSYGLLHNAKGNRLKLLIMVALFNTIVVHVILNTWWLNILLGKTWMALLPVRITKELILLPITIVVNDRVLAGLKRSSIMREVSQ